MQCVCLATDSVNKTNNLPIKASDWTPWKKPKLNRELPQLRRTSPSNRSQQGQISPRKQVNKLSYINETTGATPLRYGSAQGSSHSFDTRTTANSLSSSLHQNRCKNDSRADVYDSSQRAREKAREMEAAQAAAAQMTAPASQQPLPPSFTGRNDSGKARTQQQQQKGKVLG